jgi:hypothetical protein
MKILKHGNLKSRKFVCWHCDCEFVADTTEYRTTMSNNVVLWCHADCPECGVETTYSEPWEDKNE